MFVEVSHLTFGCLHVSDDWALQSGSWSVFEFGVSCSAGVCVSVVCGKKHRKWLRPPSASQVEECKAAAEQLIFKNKEHLTKQA